MGTGSTIVAAFRSGRYSYGLELDPTYADIAHKLIEGERELLGKKDSKLISEIIIGDAPRTGDIFKTHPKENDRKSTPVTGGK